MNSCPYCAHGCLDDTDYCTNCGKFLIRELPYLENDSSPSSKDMAVSTPGGIKVTQVGEKNVVNIGTEDWINCIKCGKPRQKRESFQCPKCTKKPICSDCFNDQERMCELCIKEPDLDPIGLFRIIARHSGKALDVDHGGQDNGTNVWQWSIHKYDNQKWELVQNKSKYYHIISIHSGKALSVEESSQENGANVFQWDFHEKPNQQWKLVKLSEEYYYIVARHSEKALSVERFSQEDGANVSQWSLHGGQNQQWKLVKIQSDDHGNWNFHKSEQQLWRDSEEGSDEELEK